MKHIANADDGYPMGNNGQIYALETQEDVM